MLALNGYSVVILIVAASFAEGAAGEPVAGVHLHGRLGGEHLQVAARYTEAPPSLFTYISFKSNLQIL